MKPETALFLQKAQDFLSKADELLKRNLWSEEAGRAAYLAGFHAAQGVLFEKTDKVFKTHKGVQGEFGRLVAGDARFDLELRAFLGQSYSLKTIADYETGLDATVGAAHAAAASATAHRFVATIETLLRNRNGETAVKPAPSSRP